MLPVAWYLLKVIICSGILYGYYWLLLRNKIFHGYNRFYLLATVLLSLLLPLLQISWWQSNAMSHNQVINVLQVVASGNEYMDEVVIHSGKQHWAIEQLYPLFYLFISFILLSVFIRTLYLIFSLLKKYSAEKIEGVSFVNTEHKSTPFSFLKYIFWNASIDLSTTQGRQIFKHEVAHIQERHTYDKLFISGVLILCWCNPFFWLIRKELNMIHEFIADKKAVEDSDTAAFAAMILQATYPDHHFNLTNNFFYSPIKRRLLMLTKNKNPKANYIGRILVLPLAVLVFAAFTLKKHTTNALPIYHGKKITVVIDPAFGGNVLGWKSPTGVYEKDINLAIAKEIRSLNTNDNIEIILTRDKDINALGECRSIVAKNHASLFITISLGQNTNNNKERGWYICIPHNSNKYYQQSKYLGNILFSSFSGNYGLPASRNALLERAWVMTFDECPSIMFQPGHITNLEDFNYFNTPPNQEKIAENILKGIEEYLVSGQVAVSRSTYITDTVPRNSLTPVTVSGYKRKTSDQTTDQLVVVDGEIKDQKFLVTYNNSNTASVNILKGDAAIKKYGEKGKNGVIEITTLKKTPEVKLVADKIIANKNNTDITLKGNVNLQGDLSKTLIYVDNKIVSEDVLKSIDPALIREVNIVKADNMVINNVEAKGKTSVIYVSLKHLDANEIKGDNDLNYKIAPKLGLDGSYNVRIKAASLKTIKKLTAGTGYEVIEATVYFSGAGFPKVESGTLNGSDLSRLQNLIDKCTAGSVITFDNVRVKGDNGYIATIEGFSAAFYDGQPGNIDDNKVFNKVEVDPSFPGGAQGWKDYLIKNIKAYIPVDEGWKTGSYTIIVQFIVHQDGTVSDVTTTNYPGSKTAQHCIDIIKNGPKWLPAMQNNHTVNAYRKQPITFVVEEQEEIKKSGAEIYKLPLKVHLMQGGKMESYDMVSNGDPGHDKNVLYFVNGKIIKGQCSVKKEDVVSIESYDAASGSKVFGAKGKYGVILIKTKG